MANPAISICGLEKSYGETRAVAGVDLQIESGEVFAVLGANGAGKTTTIEILEGFRRPDRGEVRVLGVDPATAGPSFKARIGVMLQEGGLYPAMTPSEALALFARFYPTPRAAPELIELVGLQDAARTRYRSLSGGQKQRLSLALALLPRPDIVFLDEPTAGMDPAGRSATWEIIRGLRDAGATVLLTTHYMEEAERLADRVAIMDAGRVLALDRPAALTGDATSVRLRVDTALDPAELATLPAARSVRLNGEFFVIETADAPSLLVEIATFLRDRQFPLIELRVGRGSLEDVFLQITGRNRES